MKIKMFFVVIVGGVVSNFITAHAEDTQHKFAGKETVICLKNASKSELVIVVGEQFVIDKRFRSRTIQSQPDKTSCLRYDDLQYAWVEFTTTEKAESGDQITVRDLQNRPTCRRVKGGRAKFLILNVQESGKQTCVADDRPDADIRALVANARPLTD